MKIMFLVSYLVGDGIYSTNLATAENENDVRAAFADRQNVSITVATDSMVDSYKRRGMPVVECPHIEPDTDNHDDNHEPETTAADPAETSTESEPAEIAVNVIRNGAITGSMTINFTGAMNQWNIASFRKFLVYARESDRITGTAVVMWFAEKLLQILIDWYTAAIDRLHKISAAAFNAIQNNDFQAMRNHFSASEIADVKKYMQFLDAADAEKFRDFAVWKHDYETSLEPDTAAAPVVAMNRKPKTMKRNVAFVAHMNPDKTGGAPFAVYVGDLVQIPAADGTPGYNVYVRHDAYSYTATDSTTGTLVSSSSNRA